MSKKNGDRARFGKENKKKMIRREQNLKLRQSLVNNSTEAIAAAAKTSADQPPA